MLGKSIQNTKAKDLNPDKTEISVDIKMSQISASRHRRLCPQVSSRNVSSRRRIIASCSKQGGGSGITGKIWNSRDVQKGRATFLSLSKQKYKMLRQHKFFSHNTNQQNSPLLN
jgi:hypothetical protein